MLTSLRIPVVHEPRSVTTVRHGVEVPPGDVDLDDGAPDAIWAAVERLYATGVHPAIALCIRRHGEVVLDRAIGHTHGNAPGDAPDATPVQATPDTPFCLFSASKIVTAMLIHRLDDEGLLHIGDRVVEYLPAFGRHGKEAVTIQHVLTHRAGIPTVGDRTMVPMLTDHAALVDAVCNAAPNATAGRRLAYHAISGGFVLGAIVHAVTGLCLSAYFQRHVAAPLALTDMSYGWQPDRLDDVARNAFTGRTLDPLTQRFVRRAFGVAWEEVAEIGNSREWLTGVVPSGNVVATANDACRFLQLLLDEGVSGGRRVFGRRCVRRATTETAYHTPDFTLGVPVRYGNGVILGSEHFSPFGPRTSQAFGAVGVSDVLCWADPARQLSVALLTSGKPLYSRHVLAVAALLRTISKRCTDVPRRRAA
ncbi:MAG: beta-lactamase family protein [Alphaproteobacteria bacterium]|nr:beta-lactamase family protein [Alphaproteobacteria bacterium]